MNTCIVRKIYFLNCLLMGLVALTACSSQPTLGEKMMNQGSDTVHLGKLWEEGNKNILKGEDLIKEGNEMVKDGKEMMEDGEDKVSEGKNWWKKGKSRCSKAR